MANAVSPLGFLDENFLIGRNKSEAADGKTMLEKLMSYSYIHHGGGAGGLLALALLAAGCDSSVGGGTFGEVGNGTFKYECVNDGDAACSATSAIDSFRVSEDLGRKGALPDAVAVGGVFSLSFDPFF
jgi:hypothetical protein